jgi:type III secretory pathway component EscS
LRGIEPILSTLLVVFVMSFTAVSVISLGVTLAYGTVIGLLNAFGQSQQRTAPKLVLVTSQTHASGD